jgi:hypothetical protein
MKTFDRDDLGDLVNGLGGVIAFAETLQLVVEY